MKLLLIVLLCAVAAQAGCAQPENDPLDQLRADYEALLKAQVDFEQAENAYDTNSEEQADYAVWIQQLSQRFAETCRMVSQHSSRPVPADIPCAQFTTAYSAPVGIDTTRETTDNEKTDAMVAQFNASLGEFDEKLLREQDRVKARKPLGSSSDPSDGAGMAGGQDGESGGDSEWASADDSPNEGAPEGQQSGQQGSDQTATGAQGSSSSGRPSTAPDDIPDGRDDDVIARQLREAAEKEADPELKKKLWEEYRRYKKG